MVVFKAFFPERILNKDEQFKKYSLDKRKSFLEKGIYDLACATPKSLTHFHQLYAQIGGCVESEIKALIQQQESKNNIDELQGLRCLLECFYLSRVMGRDHFWRGRQQNGINFHRERWQSIVPFMFHNSAQLLKIAHEILPAMETFLQKAQKELKKYYKKVSPVFRDGWEECLLNNEQWLKQTKEKLARAMMTLLRYNHIGFNFNQDRMVAPALNAMELVGCSNKQVKTATIRGLLGKFPSTFERNNLDGKKFSDMATIIMAWGSEPIKENFKQLRFFRYANLASETMDLVWEGDVASLFPQSCAKYRRSKLPFFKKLQWGKCLRYHFFNYERVFIYYGFNRLSECIDKSIRDKNNLLVDFNQNIIIQSIKSMDAFNHKEREHVRSLLSQCRYSIRRRKTKRFLKEYEGFVDKVEKTIVNYKLLFLESAVAQLIQMNFLDALDKVASAYFIQECRVLINGLVDLSIKHGINAKQEALKNQLFSATNVFKKYEYSVNNKKSFSYLDYYYESILGYLTPDNIHAVSGVNNIIQKKNYPSVEDYSQWMDMLFKGDKDRQERFEKNMLERYVILYLNLVKRPMETEAYIFYENCFPNQAHDYFLELKRNEVNACQFFLSFFSQRHSYLNNNETLYVNGTPLLASKENAENAAINFNRVVDVNNQKKVFSLIKEWIHQYFTGAHCEMDKVIWLINEDDILEDYIEKILAYHFKNKCVVKLINSEFFNQINKKESVNLVVEEILNDYLLSQYGLIYEEEIYDFLRDFFPEKKEKYIKSIDNMRINQLSIAIESPIASKEVSDQLKSYLESSLPFPSTKQGYESISKVLHMQSMNLVNPEVITLIIDYLGKSSFSDALADNYKEICDSLSVLYIVHDVKNRLYKKAVSKIECLFMLDREESARKKILLDELLEKYFFQQVLPQTIIERLKNEFFDKLSEKNIMLVSRQFVDNYQAVFYLKNSIVNNIEAILLGTVDHVLSLDENFNTLIDETMPMCVRQDLAKQIEPFLLSDGVSKEVKLIINALYHFLSSIPDEKYRVIFTWYGYHRDTCVNDLYENMRNYFKSSPGEEVIQKYSDWIVFYRNFYKNNKKFDFLKNIKPINSRLTETKKVNSNVKFFKKGRKKNVNNRKRKTTLTPVH